MEKFKRKYTTTSRYELGDYGTGRFCKVTFHADNVVNMKGQVTLEIDGKEFAVDEELINLIAKPAL